MYQKIQGLQKDFSPVRNQKKWHWIVQFTQLQLISNSFVLLYKFKDIQGLEFLFSNSGTFKDFQLLYEPWTKGLRSKRRRSPTIFQVIASPSNRSLATNYTYILTTPYYPTNGISKKYPSYDQLHCPHLLSRL